MIHSKLFPLAFYVAITFGLPACGGGGSSDAIPDSNGGGLGTGNSTEANAIAAAGLTFNFARDDSTSSLDGSTSSDPDGDALTYKWTQTAGTDVTAGAGFLTGVSPQFTAPSEVSTLLFDLTVNDGNGDSAAESVQVNILEHTGLSFYVDGDNGSDATGDGSRSKPYASIAFALASISGTNYDLYIKTLASGQYDESSATLTIPDGTSLYGGYNANWVRDVTNNRTVILGNKHAVLFNNVNNDAWFSGFELTAADGDGSAPFNSSAISAEAGTAVLHIQDNSIASGNTSDSASRNDSYGLRLVNLSAASVLRNTIIAGNAGNSTNTGSNGTAGISGRDGGDAGPFVNQAGGGGCKDFTNDGCPSIRNNGGDGGNGGNRGGGNGEDGKQGWFSTGGPTGGSGTQTGGSGGAGGFGGTSTRTGGDGGSGAGGAGRRGGNGGFSAGFISNGFYVNNTAVDGQNGSHGVGGGGGGEGGGFVVTGDVGAGGGGGGQGGIGGTGGGAGGSGGASIGILLSSVSDAVIDDNTITSGNGGNGAAGGLGSTGGRGGDGGFGGGVNDKGAAGGDGGGGGMGGGGGQGGAGAGGSSHGIFVNRNIAPTISNNIITTGNGGAPGADGAGSGGGAIGGRNGSPGVNRLGGVTPRSTRAATGTPAEGGWAYNIYDIDSADGLVPALNNNVFTTGSAGIRGNAGDKNF